jgi:hypothetical protein
VAVVSACGYGEKHRMLGVGKRTRVGEQYVYAATGIGRRIGVKHSARVCPLRQYLGYIFDCKMHSIAAAGDCRLKEAVVFKRHFVSKVQI